MKKEQSVLSMALSYVWKVLSITLTILLVFISALLVFYVAMFVHSHVTGQPPKFPLYTISTGSMEPNIRVGDIIVNIRIDDPSTVNVGDVITFRSPVRGLDGKTVTHRVINIIEVDGRREFETKGDANTTQDPANVSEEDLIGRVIFRIPFVGRLQDVFSSPIRLVVFLLIPVALIIIYDIAYLGWLAAVKKRGDKLEDSEVDIEELNKREEDKKIEETLENIKKAPPVVEFEPEVVTPITQEPVGIQEVEEPIVEEIIEIEDDITQEEVIITPEVEEPVKEMIQDASYEEEIISAAIERMKATNQNNVTLFEESTFIDFETEEIVDVPIISEKSESSEEIYMVGRSASSEDSYQTIGDEDAYVKSPISNKTNEVITEVKVNDHQSQSNQRNRRRRPRNRRPRSSNN